MKAQRLTTPARVETQPLRYVDVDAPTPAAHEILVQVTCCGVCHTDLHVVEGELPDPLLPIIPGHQIVGVVAQCGAAAHRFSPGDRVGIPWLHQTCGRCEFCQRGEENLCPYARFTGYTAQGGYAEYTTVAEDFAVPLPPERPAHELAPLLCAGIVGYRALRLAGVQRGERVGLVGYGGSADICIQVAHYWDCAVYVFTRSAAHQQLARNRGAQWAGQAGDAIDVALDRIILFAPAGGLVPATLKYLRKGGTLCINAIHTSPIPEMPYDLLWGERVLRTVANATRRDAEEFLALAGQIPVQTATQTFPLQDANQALQMLKRSAIQGTAVLDVG